MGAREADQELDVGGLSGAGQILEDRAVVGARSRVLEIQPDIVQPDEAEGFNYGW